MILCCCCCCGCYSRNFTSIKIYKVKYIICNYKTRDLYFFVFILMTYILCNQYSVFRYLIEMVYKMWLVDTSILFRILLLSTPCGPITNFWEKWLVRACKKVGFFLKFRPFHISPFLFIICSFLNLPKLILTKSWPSLSCACCIFTLGACVEKNHR